MRRRAVLSLFAVISLTGCAHQASAPAVRAPEMAWSLTDAEGEGAKLAFGQPQTDNVLLMLTCQPRSGEVRVSMTAPEGSAAKALKLSSGGRSAQLKGEAAPSGLGEGMLVEASARADDPVLARFARSGELAVSVGARRTELPADPQKSRRFVEACRGA